MSMFSLINLGGTATLVILGICSVLIVAVILERTWAFRRIGKVPKELIRRVEALIAAGQVYESVRLLDEYDSPYARIARTTLMRKDATLAEINDMLTIACETELDGVSRPLTILGTIGNIAPFIGLFGTILGVMRAFANIAQQQSAGTSVVSKGLSEALVATAIGIAVAVVAVIANNWFNAWVEHYRLDLERFSTEWSHQLAAVRRASDVTEPVA